MFSRESKKNAPHIVHLSEFTSSVKLIGTQTNSSAEKVHLHFVRVNVSECRTESYRQNAIMQRTL